MPRVRAISSTTLPAWNRSCCATWRSTRASPPSKGYVRFEARPTSDTILLADREDPLLVRWQYGLGRASVFTSDAKNRWAANWVSWPGFDRLWANIFRDL